MICLNYELYFRETIVYVRMYVVLTLGLGLNRVRTVRTYIWNLYV